MPPPPTISIRTERLALLRATRMAWLNECTKELH